MNHRLSSMGYPLLLVVVACSSSNAATNTGNPGGEGAPDGIDVVRSSLQRETDPEVSQNELATFGQDTRDFALELYSELASDEGNLFFSPYSISVALGMLYAGAAGETKAEMTEALHFSLSEPTLHAAFNATDLSLDERPNQLVEEGSGDLQLRVVNGAFTQTGAPFEADYLDVLALHYEAGMFEVDFAGDPEPQRLAINRWVEEQTEARIQDLLPEGSITPLVRLVLANAIYFKGSWLVPFDPAATEEEVFHTFGGDVQVPMMNGDADQYFEGDGFQALELPYVAPAMRMVFVLPDEGEFEAVEASFDRVTFDEIRNGLSGYSVTLKVPKFSFDSGFSLPAALRALGMQQAFEASVADLSGISTMDLFVSDVFHKAFVAVDERGTEAAAATAVIDSVRSAPPPADFFLDRPFLFLIYDEPTGQILFMGRVVDPS